MRLNAVSGNITIKNIDDPVEAIDVTSGQVTGSGSAQITVNPQYIDSSTEYYVLIDATAFDDVSEIVMLGLVQQPLLVLL